MCFLIWPICGGLRRSVRMMLVARWTATRDAMATTPTSPEHHTAPPDLDTLLAWWRRHLAAQRMSPAKLAIYSAAVRGLDAFLADPVMPRGRP